MAGVAAAEIMAAPTERLRRLPRVPAAFRVRPATPDDVPELERLDADPEKTRRFFDAGDACLLAIADGAIQAVEWLRAGPAEYADDARRLGVRFRIPAGSCWLHNGRNVADDSPGPWGMVMGSLRGYLEQRGIASAFLQVDAAEPYSRACHESLGFRTVARVAALRVRGARFVRLHPRPEHFSRAGGGVVDLDAWSVSR
jgi:hypothetical protein